MQKSHSLILESVLVCAIIFGCGGRDPAHQSTTKTAQAQPTVKKRVSDRKGNADGGVFVVEYHKIAKQEARWDRSINKFKSDLQRIYDLGFRPVSMSSFLSGKMDLAPGASPIVFTFDDSHPSQFTLLPDGNLDPDCALGIWQEFSKTHPDFPISAIFFILPPTGPWGQPKLASKKFEMLKKWVCEVGSHTINHPNLKKVTDLVAKSEIEDAVSYIKKHGFEPTVIALPYGISPNNPVILKKYHRAALLVGSNPAPPPGSTRFDPMRIPRIQGIDGDFGITYWLDKVEKGTYKPFIQP